METGFFEWSTLGTVGGATAVVTMLLYIVEYLFGSRMSTGIRNAVVVVASIAILEATSVSAGGGTWETYVLSAINGLVVALAVLRLYDVTVPGLKARL
jgi:hypothetical protein